MAIKGKRLFHPQAHFNHEESQDIPLGSEGLKVKGSAKQYREEHPHKEELTYDDLLNILTMAEEL